MSSELNHIENFYLSQSEENQACLQREKLLENYIKRLPSTGNMVLHFSISKRK